MTTIELILISVYGVLSLVFVLGICLAAKGDPKPPSLSEAGGPTGQESEATVAGLLPLVGPNACRGESAAVLPALVASQPVLNATGKHVES